ncbi:hypothetical protein Cantr_07290 [Candida viswanathii]|uniref:Uncharacterized protein n=1 Tax=Candida viswanathii TaxID=5486 RepID=A0A367XZ47_9ASCO|nr:hypothetical protein Cantr_07290 [Candida viswanathii]
MAGINSANFGIKKICNCLMGFSLLTHFSRHYISYAIEKQKIEYDEDKANKTNRRSVQARILGYRMPPVKP